MHEYPKAGVPGKAQPGVVEAVEEFRELPPKVQSRLPLLYWLLGDGTSPYKMSKEDAAYGPPPPEKRSEVCGNCRFAYARVINGQLICSQVDGQISYPAWCRLWRGGDGKQKPRSWRTRMKRLLGQRK
tara:strand:+ start:40 stop:423 length:384 start_codon:yes stop_codon:yes gene_type:complete